MGYKFQCPKCDYESSYKSAIVSHQKSIHMGQKPKKAQDEYSINFLLVF